MKEFASTDEFRAALVRLIDGWCDRRNLAALARLLPGYIGFNGLTDGWADLSHALKATRALGAEAFPNAEWDVLNDLIHTADVVVYRR